MNSQLRDPLSNYVLGNNWESHPILVSRLKLLPHTCMYLYLYLYLYIRTHIQKHTYTRTCMHTCTREMELQKEKKSWSLCYLGFHDWSLHSWKSFKRTNFTTARKQSSLNGVLIKPIPSQKSTKLATRIIVNVTPGLSSIHKMKSYKIPCKPIAMSSFDFFSRK